MVFDDLSECCHLQVSTPPRISKKYPDFNTIRALINPFTIYDLRFTEHLRRHHAHGMRFTIYDSLPLNPPSPSHLPNEHLTQWRLSLSQHLIELIYATAIAFAAFH